MIIYCDGFCDSNPGGIATYGWIAKQGDNEIHSHCGFTRSGPDANGTMAEYVAVISALEWLLGNRYSDKTNIRSDSQQILGQIKGSYEVRPEAPCDYAWRMEKVRIKRKISCQKTMEGVYLDDVI